MAFILAHWVFFPYLAMVCFLSVMSAREGVGRKEKALK
jgi:hypothetical protein